MSEPESMFPFTLYCNRDKGYSEYAFREAFLAVKPEKLSWYGYDVIVESQDRVTFVAFEMLDNVYGGVGDEKFRLPAVVGAEMVRDSVERRAKSLARLRRADELHDAEERVIQSYADALLAELEKSA